jgi:hypothetical protein
MSCIKFLPDELLQRNVINSKSDTAFMQSSSCNGQARIKTKFSSQSFIVDILHKCSLNLVAGWEKNAVGKLVMSSNY